MKVVFSTATIHARDKLEYWREEATKAAAEHEFETSRGRDFFGRIRAGTLGNLLAFVLENDACLVQHTSRSIKHASDDDLLLSLQLAGSLIVRHNGREAVTSANDMYLLDPRRPFAIEVPEFTRTLIIKVPRPQLQDRLGEVGELAGRLVTHANPVGALASGFLAMIPDRIHGLDPVSGDKIAQQVLDLVALAFSTEAAEQVPALSSSRRATLLRLKAIIEDNLCDPGLRPGTVAETAGISVRYANALLAVEDTSLERFIMIRRLERCRRMLEDPAQALRTVGEIAFACGFSDLSHFSRRFKARFGFPPSECRARAS